MPPLFEPGHVFRSYQVEEFIAEGAHGEVYAARSLVTGQLVALKVTRLVHRSDASKIERLLAAARGAYAIRHPNVAEVHDLGCDDDGTVYLVGELLQGGTIERVLRWGWCSAVFALSVGIEAAKGLAASHLAMVVHRDVKPSNLFVVTLGPRRTAIKVLDFSLAKAFQENAGLGTLSYMGPEQLAGAAPHPTMDVHGLGMTLYEMLAGRHPWHEVLADRAALVDKQRNAMPPLLSEVTGLPARIDAVIFRALAKDPAARYRTMAEMAVALFELRAWLVQEHRAGNLFLRVPGDEPAAPGEVDPYEVGSPRCPPQAAPPLHGFDLPDPSASLPLGGATLQALLRPEGEDR
jgi:serine/threonine-protein kinase